MKQSSSKAQQQIQQRTWDALRKAAKADTPPASRQADYWPEPGIAG